MPATSINTSGDAAGRPFLALLPAALLTLFVLAAGAASFYAPPAQGEMAVVFPPGTSEASAYYSVLQAGGRFVGPTRLPNVIVAFGADTGFADRVRTQGALFLLAAHGLCAPQLSQRAT